MQVEKRNGNLESVRFDKITSRINYLLYNLKIDPVIITQKIANRIYDGIKTSEIDELASNICISMILENPEYGVLASRLIIDNHQKNTDKSFKEVIYKLYKNKDINGNSSPLINDELYGISIELQSVINSIIKPERDFLLDYFGFRTLEKAYLLKVDKKIIERPQHLFMRVAIGLHGKDIENIKKTYDNLSQLNYSHATPTLFHAGTPRQQLSSCFLMGTVDSIEGIFKTITDCAKISKWAGGIGLHCSNIRARESYIRKTGGESQGIFPMLKVYNDVMRYINQSGKRPGSCAIYLEPWHADVMEFLEGKKPTGSHEERARDLFYALWIPDLFMKCVKDDDDWYLMCPDECPGLSDVYGDEFDTLYRSYIESDKYRKKIPARELWKAILSSQVETGTPYICYKDASNKKSNQKNLGTIKSSNLCSEIILYSDEKETAVCNLGAVCLSKILKYKSETELKEKGISNDNNIIVYGSDECSYCDLVKMDFNSMGIKYVLANKEDTENFLKENSLTTIPQITINNQLLGGYDNLWSIIKPVVDWDKLAGLTESLTINLNKVIVRNFYPTPETERSNTRHRPIGIGVQGLADLFIKLRLPYTSPLAKKLNKLIFENIYYTSLKTSCALAKIHGPYDSFKNSPMSEGKFQFDLWENNDDFQLTCDWDDLRNEIKLHGIRNSVLTSVMPTASTSQIMGNNECIEPFTSNLYNRRTMAGEFTVINKFLIKDLINLGIWNSDTKDRLIYFKGSVQSLKIPELLKEVYKTVWEIPQKDCIDMSADRGRFICQSQSLNIWFKTPTFKKLSNAHFHSWKSGLKTGSYYIRSQPPSDSQNFTLDPNKEKLYKSEEQECLMCSG
jgi:ribonucleoside-diphosphate reductase subunit M1